MINGAIEGEIAANGHFDLEKREPIRLDGSHIDATLSAVLKANFASIYFNSTAQIKTGVAFDDGILSCSVDDPVKISGKLVFSGVTLSGVVQKDGPDSDFFEISLVLINPGKVLWSGTWPES